MTPSAETHFHVRYAETDQMGVVYYANYLVWMEVGRVEFCKSFGFNYRDMEQEDGILMAVVEANCRYLSPARFDDHIVVETRIEQATSRTVTFAYEMRLVASGRKLASGHTRHMLVDRQFRRTRLPEKYFVMFGIDAKSKTMD
ncbi:MAG: acyl-CoA thioesterase [Terriglobia bacterium]|nr:MAG: acyl-CoA thioesterase [Terriglobia bacterium]